MVIRDEGWGEGIVREFGINMYTLFKMDNVPTAGNRPSACEALKSTSLTPFASVICLQRVHK